MGLLAPAASLCHFEVIGDLPSDQIFQFVSERLHNERFRSIEKSIDEYSCGWVEMDDHDAAEFAEERQLLRERTLCFALREDRRKIPAALLKREITRISAEYLEAHPTFNRVPKSEREAIRDLASSQLFSRTLPVPAVSDIVWKIDSGLLRFTSLSQNRIDSFQGLFHQSFPELRLRLLTPLARANAVANAEQKEQLAELNQANSDTALEEIEANSWMGEELLQWLLYRSLNSDSGYAVCTPGPLLMNQPFNAWLDNRLLLVGSGTEGEQKISVAGPQDRFSEVCAALRSGKRIAEATLHLSLGEEQSWKLTLKGERFSFGGFRTPMIKPDKDPVDDPKLEVEAAFYSKMVSIEEGEQLFASLIKTFFERRLNSGWDTEAAKIIAWFKEQA
ncbi:recombination-associated protein RdgC [Geopsychrobacter electrodiphilus]|uniref:recombination-associated protein RdgC n=1 Tax=Geopsychrobacter electrodiphilus TaxID=225196 RepID=UPI000375D201|nr:recombination-associated protein RdgC [Geopsychrobacter electrodiphilus]